MSFSLSDVRFSSRRDADGVPVLYPRLMRDRSSHPKIAIAIRHFESMLSLRPGELDRLLFLDAEEHAVLVRVGAEPRPEDVAAQLNFSALEALIRHSSVVELNMAAGAGALLQAARAVAEVNVVDVT